MPLLFIQAPIKNTHHANMVHMHIMLISLSLIAISDLT